MEAVLHMRCGAIQWWFPVMTLLQVAAACMEPQIPGV